MSETLCLSRLVFVDFCSGKSDEIGGSQRTDGGSDEPLQVRVTAVLLTFLIGCACSDACGPTKTLECIIFSKSWPTDLSTRHNNSSITSTSGAARRSQEPKWPTSFWSQYKTLVHRNIIQSWKGKFQTCQNVKVCVPSELNRSQLEFPLLLTRATQHFSVGWLLMFGFRPC